MDTDTAVKHWRVGDEMASPYGMVSVEDPSGAIVACADPQHATLIASAPALLAALQALVAELELASCESAHNGQIFDQAIAAIQQAEGA